jgi:hypothetical protein
MVRESHESAREKIRERIKEGRELKGGHLAYTASQEEVMSFNKAYQKWDEYNRDLLLSLYTNSTPATEYNWSVATPMRSYRDSDFEIYQRNLVALDKKCDKLESLADRIILIPITPEVSVQAASQSRPEGLGVPANAISLVEKICLRFHLVVGQLRSRHEGRETLVVKDEYDVQDLMHALLRLFFEDVRPEEWTPSYAGKSARMDFLLKSESIVLEAKKTRPGLGARQVGEELIVDIARYRGHADCKTLVCFVYDPDGMITNPRGLERDLTREEGDMSVRVFVVPRG